MMNVALGAKDEDTLTSLASRIVRLNAQMTASERKEFQEITGASAGQTAQALLDAFDPDVIAVHAGVSLPDEGEPTPEQQALLDAAKQELAAAAVAPFHRPEVRDYIENVRRKHEQIIDNVNIDTVLLAGCDVNQEEAESERCHQGAAVGLLCHLPAGQGKEKCGGDTGPLCRAGQLQFPAVVLPPQRRGRPLYRRADGVAAAD